MFRVASNRSALSAGLVISVDIRAIFPAAAKAWRRLHKALFDTYRPELHYMRGPGPKWRERHGALQTSRSGAVVKPAASNRPLKTPHRAPPPSGGVASSHQGDRASRAFDARSSKGAPRCNASDGAPAARLILDE